IPLLAILHHGRIPIREIVHAAPGNELLAGQSIRSDRQRDPVLPVAELRSRDQRMLDGAPLGGRRWRTAEIEILDALHDAEPNAASLVERDRFRAAFGKSLDAFFGVLPTAEEPHVLDDAVAAVGIARGLCQMVAADPDQPIRIGRAAAQPLALL